jgi:hypothetical protein
MKWENPLHTEMELLQDPRVRGRKVSNVIEMPSKKKAD